MTAKEYLSQVKKLDVQIDLDLRELSRWRDLSKRISAGNTEPNYNSNRNIDAPFVKCIDNIIELENKINSEVDTLAVLKSRITDIFHSIDNSDYQAVLELRYLDYLKWNEIASKMEYSRRWVYKIHAQALSVFEKFI